ncbi:hypothetical protein Taro_022461 [Colocasia esculenta]|uniref:Aminotransferase-like plant mobile domain-containing protein n=1 Tax=Colocasia esculenta TaxID=4460 RepID=A0A843V7Z2_COLES|nr:hypothetical protein [Colocasia esculenta]
MGFGEIFRIERMRVDPVLTQALLSRWDAEASAFAFPWGHMIPSLEDVSQISGLRVYGRAVSGYTYPCYHELAEQLLDLPVERRSSLVPRVALQESLGLYEAGKNAGECEDEYLERLARVSRRELASEPRPQADLDLRRFLVLFLGRLLFAMRGDAVHCRFLPLLEDLGEVGGYAWGAAFLAHQFDGLSVSERQTSTSGFYPFLQVWAYLHLPALGRRDLTRPGLVPIARRWDSHRDTRHLADQLERLQEAIDCYPYMDVVWQLYLGEGDEGQLWLAQACPCFGRSVWLHALNLVSVVEFPVRDRFRRPGRSFRGLHDTTDWHERAREQIENWERKGKAVRSDATTDDAYLQVYALKYGGKVYKSARHQVDVTCEIASLRVLLHSAMQDREAAQRQTAELRSELERVSGVGAGGASSSRSAGGSPSLLEAQLVGAVLRAEEAQRHLKERGEAQATPSERDQLCIRAKAAEAQISLMTRELAMLRVQRPPTDQKEVTRLRAELLAQQTLIVTDIGRSRSRSRSGASVSRATGAFVRQYLAGSSSRRRNEEEERHRQGEGSAHDGRGGGEMLPPPDRQEGSGESGGGYHICGRVMRDSLRWRRPAPASVDVTGGIASLRALLYSAMQDREAAQRQTAELRSELERVRGAGAGGASSAWSARGSPSLLEGRLAGAVLRAEEAQRHLEERERDLQLTTEHAMELQGERDRFQGEAQATWSERDQLRIRAEAAEAQISKMTRELAALRVQTPPANQEETLARSLQQIVTDIGRSRSQSRSRASVSRATGASVGQYLAGSSSRRRNEEEERRRQGEGSAHDGRGGGEMLPPPNRQKGSRESGGG